MSRGVRSARADEGRTTLAWQRLECHHIIASLHREKNDVMMCAAWQGRTEQNRGVCNPLGDFLCHNEAANETDNLWEEAANTSLQHGHRHAIAEAQQCDDAAPADVALTEKPDTSKALMCCKPCKNNYFSTRILTGVSKFKDCRHWKDLVHEGSTPQAGYI